MVGRRRIQAVFQGARALRNAEACGLILAFRPEGGSLETDLIEDFADLGPENTLEAVAGLGKVLRLLRATRVAAPADARELLGEPERAVQILARARDTRLQLEVRTRSSIRFVAWTEDGVETIHDVSDVHVGETAFIVERRSGRLPVRLERTDVVRQRTERDVWYEVMEIERA